MDQSKAERIVAAMKPWYTERKAVRFVYPDMRARSVEKRTDAQRIWDHAILTAAEFVRRYDNYDEERMEAMMGLLSDNLPSEP